MALPQDIIEIPEYRLIEELVHSDAASIVLVSGRAGTGKSVAIRWLSSRFEGAHAIVAPTGLAAIQVGGQTIHSFFRFPPRAIQSSDIKPPGSRSREVFAHLKVLIIDEISMVRADLMDGIALFLSRFGPQPGKPFGGVKLVLVGDLLQLPPVIESVEEREWIKHTFGSEYFFSASCFRKHSWVPVELTRVFRQTEKDFVDALSRIRSNTEIRPALEWLNAGCVRTRKPDGALEISLVPTRVRAESINREELGRLPLPERRYSARIEGRMPMDRKMPSPNDLDLRVGAQVMFTKNDKERRWVNGTMGRVVSLDASSVTVQIDGAAGAVCVTEDRWDQYEYSWDPAQRKLVAKVAGSFIQIPLAYAWATTIHKAQGQTFDHALVDMANGAFASGQTYVALSRCRTRAGLRLRRALREDDVRIDPNLVEAYRTIQAAASRIDPERMARELRAARGA
jgi:ATP-dependent DNA helicase PIF1